MANADKIIMIVEDEPLLGNLLKQKLERDGFKVIHSKDGEAALGVLKENKPDLLLLDVILPKISGFELLERINSDPVLSSNKPPTVIISNLGQESDVQRGQQLGAIGYFVKAQLSMDDLSEKVKEFFGQV